jgi:hypothetical protein
MQQSRAVDGVFPGDADRTVAFVDQDQRIIGNTRRHRTPLAAIVARLAPPFER